MVIEWHGFISTSLLVWCISCVYTKDWCVSERRVKRQAPDALQGCDSPVLPMRKCPGESSTPLSLSDHCSGVKDGEAWGLLMLLHCTRHGEEAGKLTQTRAGSEVPSDAAQLFSPELWTPSPGAHSPRRTSKFHGFIALMQDNLGLPPPPCKWVILQHGLLPHQQELIFTCDQFSSFETNSYNRIRAWIFCKNLLCFSSV